MTEFLPCFSQLLSTLGITCIQSMMILEEDLELLQYWFFMLMVCKESKIHTDNYAYKIRFRLNREYSVHPPQLSHHCCLLKN